MLIGAVYSVRYEVNGNDLRFGFGDEQLKEGIIVFETDTEPLLVSIEKSFAIRNFVDVISVNDLRVSKDEPLVVRLNARYPGRDVSGYLNINLLYEKLPEEINYYGDDTIRVPVALTSDGESVAKMNVKLTEELLPGEETTPLDVGVLLPIVVIVLLLFLFKRKWSKT